MPLITLPGTIQFARLPSSSTSIAPDAEVDMTAANHREGIALEKLRTARNFGDRLFAGIESRNRMPTTGRESRAPDRKVVFSRRNGMLGVGHIREGEAHRPDQCRQRDDHRNSWLCVFFERRFLRDDSRRSCRPQHPGRMEVE